MNPIMTNEQNAPAYEALVDRLIDAVAEDAFGGREDQGPDTKAARAELLAALSSPPAAGDAVACEFCGGRGFTDDGHVEWDGQVVSAPEGCVECDGRGSVPAAAPKPAAPPSVTDAVRALVAKWRAEANGIDILDCSKAGLVNNCADELEAALSANKPVGEEQ